MDKSESEGQFVSIFALKTFFYQRVDFYNPANIKSIKLKSISAFPTDKTRLPAPACKQWDSNIKLIIKHVFSNKCGQITVVKFIKIK